jgi:hypothetical protein
MSILTSLDEVQCFLCDAKQSENAQTQEVIGCHWQLDNCNFNPFSRCPFIRKIANEKLITKTVHEEPHLIILKHGNRMETSPGIPLQYSDTKIQTYVIRNIFYICWLADEEVKEEFG